MQHTNMYSIHDAAAGAYLPPFFFENDLLAIRAFSALLNDSNHLFSKEPNDFILFRFGTFDVVEGTIELEPIPLRVRAGVSLIKRNEDGDQLSMFEKETANG